jgi:hypothetical protein
MKPENNEIGNGEEVNLGPYTREQYDGLNKLSDLRMKLLNKQLEAGMPDETEEVTTVANLIKDAEATIHKTASAISRHDTGVSQAASAEVIASYLTQVSMDASEEFKNNKFHNKDSIGQEDVPKLVKGHTLDGIEKPTLKEIMDTDMEEDE